MKTLRNFTFPTFLSICSVWAAFADMLQNSSMFSGILVALIGLGLLAFVLPASIIARSLGALFGADAAIRFSIKPFGTSCLILAGMIYVFAAMSSQAAPSGGALAKAFPEIERLQIALGRLEQSVGDLNQKTDEIKSDTSELVEATKNWIVTYASYTSAKYGEGDKPHTDIRIDNETGTIFENVHFVIKDGTHVLKRDFIPILTVNMMENYYLAQQQPYENLSTCITGKIRGKNIWMREKYYYKVIDGYDLSNRPDVGYGLSDMEDLTTTSYEQSC